MRNLYAILAVAWMFILGPLAIIGLGQIPGFADILNHSGDDWKGVLALMLCVGLYFGGIGLFVRLSERQ